MENINRNRDRTKNFSNNHKPRLNPQPYRKHNNNFPTNKNFKKLGTKPYVPAPNAKKPATTGGVNVSPLQIKC